MIQRIKIRGETPARPEIPDPSVRCVYTEPADGFTSTWYHFPVATPTTLKYAGFGPCLTVVRPSRIYVRRVLLGVSDLRCRQRLAKTSIDKKRRNSKRMRLKSVEVFVWGFLFLLFCFLFYRFIRSKFHRDWRVSVFKRRRRIEWEIERAPKEREKERERQERMSITKQKCAITRQEISFILPKEN